MLERTKYYMHKGYTLHVTDQHFGTDTIRANFQNYEIYRN